MKFCSKRRFKRLRRQLIKEMRKVVDNPNEFIKHIDSLQLLYYRFFDDETTKTDRRVEGYLQTKGLPTMIDIQGVLQMRQQIKEDNLVVIEYTDKVDAMEIQISDLQEYVVLQVSEMKTLRNQVQKKLRVLQQITVTDAKRVRKSKNIN